MKAYTVHKKIISPELLQRDIAGYFYGSFPFVHQVEISKSCIKFDPVLLLQEIAPIESEKFDIDDYLDSIKIEPPKGQLLTDEPNDFLASERDKPEYQYVLARFTEAFGDRLQAHKEAQAHAA
jgi:hypothetical protein